MPGSIRFMYILTFLYLGLMIYSFTPVTQSMDDIKVSVLYLGGPILLCFYLFFSAWGRLRLFPASLFIPLGVFLLTVFFSTLLAGKHYSWIGWQQMGFQISLLGAFFCGFGLMRSKKDIHRILFIWTLLGLGTTVFGLFQYSGGFRILNRIFISDPKQMITLSNLFNSFITNENEMFSTILSRQFYAAFLVMLLPLAAAYTIVEEKSHSRRYLGVAAMMLSGICLYLTHSKASAGAVFVVAVVFFILYKSYAHYKKIRIPHPGIWLAGFLMIGATLGFFTSDIGPAKFKTISRSVASRAIIWKGGWDMFLYGPGPDNWYELEGKPPLCLRSLLVGCGPGAFRLIFPRYRNPDYLLHDISHVTLFSHNRFLDLLAETGLVGFLSYMTLLAAFFAKGAKALLHSDDGELRVYSIAFLCSLLGVFLTNLFSPNSRWAVMGANLWAMWGMGLGAFYVAEDAIKETKDKGREVAERIFTPSPVVANAFLVLIVLFLPVVYLCSRYAVIYFNSARHNYAGLYYKESVADGNAREAEKLANFAKDHPEKADELKKDIARYRMYVEKSNKLAIEAFNKAVYVNPTFLTAYYKLAHTYSKIGDNDNALKIYLEIGKYAPDYSEIHYNLGAVYDAGAGRLREKASSLGNTPERQELLTRIDEIDALSLRELKIAARMSNASQVQSAYARKLFQLQKFPEADKVYEFLLKMKPEEQSYLQWLAVSADRQNNIETALKYYTRMFEIDPLNDLIFNRIEQLYKILDQPRGLEAFLLKSLETNPLNLKLRLRLLELYIREKEMEKARKQLTILTRIPEISRMISYYPEKRQEGLLKLAQKAESLEHREAEIFFLKQCLDLDASTSIGKACRNRLNNLSP
jgi:tetratricopeptide (TPR) repeat protein